MSLLAVIPARGGSKGLPGKNIRPFAGLPLIAHSILFAQLCPEITRTIVSTDSPEIAKVAQSYGADVPFLRPAELARDDTPVWSVLRHTLQTMKANGSAPFDTLALLDPTSPARETTDVSQALRKLENCPEADGVVGVSRPTFHPIWHCVVERNGWMTDLIKEAGQFDRRQELPAVYRINGSLYLWRSSFVERESESWRRGGRHLLYEIPELRAMSIDNEDQFRQAELLVESGLIRFPWLTSKVAQ